jgi:hypothetical protein
MFGTNCQKYVCAVMYCSGAKIRDSIGVFPDKTTEIGKLNLKKMGI